MSVNQYEKEMNEIFWSRVTRLFGYSNPMKKNNEELTDFFIPFEDDILLLEDKSRESEFIIDKNLNIFNIEDKMDSDAYSELIKNWVKFYTSKIKKAVKQLNGAEEYLKNNNMVYKNRNKIEGNLIEYNSNAQIHKIILLHNIDNGTGKFFNSIYGGLLYSKCIDSNKEGFAVKVDIPENIGIFKYGFFDKNTHVLTEQQFKFIMSYLPTLRDILDYLRWKERFLYYTNYDVIEMDEYSLVCYYIEFGETIFEELDSLKEEGLKITNVFLDIYSDNDLLSLELTNERFKKYKNSVSIINELLHHLEENKQFAESEQGLKNQIMKHYLKLNMNEQLELTEAFSKLLNITYNKTSVKGCMFYARDCLYLFFNIDDRIKESDMGNEYIKGVVTKYALIYLEKFKDKINIKDIVIYAFHQFENGDIKDYFVSLNISEIINNVKELKKYVNELDKFLPKKIEKSLKDFVENYNKKRIYVKGRDRNKPCPCGSGVKYKKCCGKYL